MYDKPVWIRLYNLPIEYWGDINLEKIGHYLGTLLEIDEGSGKEVVGTILGNSTYYKKEVPTIQNLEEQKSIEQPTMEEKIEVEIVEVSSSSSSESEYDMGAEDGGEQRWFGQPQS
ncbi:hypothetical protein SUGI_1164330 [Cryptomeria japonica]|nr:hypothetical protein SUGI_1164330 [Cryptomeria japonica]